MLITIDENLGTVAHPGKSTDYIPKKTQHFQTAQIFQKKIIYYRQSSTTEQNTKISPAPIQDYF